MFKPLRVVLYVFTVLTIIPLSCCSCYSEQLTIRLPKYQDSSHLYYHELIKASLEQIGVTARIIITDYYVPQKRAVFMLKHDRLDGVWLVRSKIRDKLYTSPEVGLTNGLIGKRVFFIPKGDKKKYSDISTIEDFRKLNLTGAFGKDWFDTKIWLHNNLKYISVDGDWRKIYSMVARRINNFDYFSRGVNEIVLETKAHPELDIEERLLFVYERDFQLYLGKSGARHKTILSKALQKAKESGLMDRLIRKHWSEVYSTMNLDKRIKIRLELPDS